jgi:hypothetical protein
MAWEIEQALPHRQLQRGVERKNLSQLRNRLGRIEAVAEIPGCKSGDTQDTAASPVIGSRQGPALPSCR